MWTKWKYTSKAGCQFCRNDHEFMGLPSRPSPTGSWAPNDTSDCWSYTGWNQLKRFGKILWEEPPSKAKVREPYQQAYSEIGSKVPKNFAQTKRFQISAIRGKDCVETTDFKSSREEWPACADSAMECGIFLASKAGFRKHLTKIKVQNSPRNLRSSGRGSKLDPTSLGGTICSASILGVSLSAGVIQGVWTARPEPRKWKISLRSFLRVEGWIPPTRSWEIAILSRSPLASEKWRPWQT